MSSIHNALQRGIINDALKRATGLTKSGSAIERMGETLTPIIDLWSRPEWSVLNGEGLMGANIVQPVVAGQLSFICLGNPTGSGMIVVVTRISARDQTLTDDFIIGIAGDPPAGVVASAPWVSRDRRFRGGNTFGRAQIRRGSNVASIGFQINERTRLLTTQHTELISPPYTLRPGDCVVIEDTVAAEVFDANFEGYERQAYPGELTP